MVIYPKHANEKDTLTVQQNVAKFNTGKSQIVWHTSEMKKQWLHCSKGSMKWNQHKAEINKAMRWCSSDF